MKHELEKTIQHSNESALQIRNEVIENFFHGKVDSVHNFRIGIDSVRLTPSDVENLESIAFHIPLLIDGMQKLSELSLIDDPLRRKSPMYRRLRNALGKGKEYETILTINRESGKKPEVEDIAAQDKILSSFESKFHPIVKVDLVRSQDGDFKIVELEVNKTHGFGYATLGRTFTTEPLVGSGLLQEIKNLSKGARTGLILSSGAEFYELEAEYFIRQSNKSGVNLVLLQQAAMAINKEGLYKRLEGEKIEQIITLPALQNSNRGRWLDPQYTIKLVDQLCGEGKLASLSKRNPDLSDKTFLGLVSNGSGDADLEDLLTNIYTPEVLSNLRKHIPKTEAINFTLRRKEAINAVSQNSSGFYVKEVVSSGTHGVAIAGDVNAQMELIKSKSVVIQEAIDPKFHRLRFMDVNSGKMGQDDFSIRYVLFAGNKGNIIDIGLTGSPGIMAHGARNSIFLPPVIVT